MCIRSTNAFNMYPHQFYLWKPCFKPRHACAVKPEVLISWTLEIDYSRAPCLGLTKRHEGSGNEISLKQTHAHSVIILSRDVLSGPTRSLSSSSGIRHRNQVIGKAWKKAVDRNKAR